MVLSRARPPLPGTPFPSFFFYFPAAHRGLQFNKGKRSMPIAQSQEQGRAGVLRAWQTPQWWEKSFVFWKESLPPALFPWRGCKTHRWCRGSTAETIWKSLFGSSPRPDPEALNYSFTKAENSLELAESSAKDHISEPTAIKVQPEPSLWTKRFVWARAQVHLSYPTVQETIS